ncbi:TPA: DUF1471 domain-containing protein [Citrobacter freundii]
MKKTIALLFAASLLPFPLLAKTVTATGDTLEHTENKIRQITQQEGGKTYKIIEARMGNTVHITAEVLP